MSSQLTVYITLLPHVSNATKATPTESYVKTIVDRYKNSSAIFAWELMNEARCASDLIPAGPACVPGSNTLHTWYQEQSNFVRSLYETLFLGCHLNTNTRYVRDPNHLITTGGEGMFYWAQPPIMYVK